MLLQEDPTPFPPAGRRAPGLPALVAGTLANLAPGMTLFLSLPVVLAAACAAVALARDAGVHGHSAWAARLGGNVVAYQRYGLSARARPRRLHG